LFLNASRVFHYDGHSSYLAFRLFLDVFRLCSAAGSCPERHWNISGIIFIPASVYHLTVASLRLYDRYKRHVWLSLGGFRAVSNQRFLRLHICFRRPSGCVGLLSDLQLDGGSLCLFLFRPHGLEPASRLDGHSDSCSGIGKLWNRGLLAAFCTAYLGSFQRTDKATCFAAPSTIYRGHSVYRSIRSVAGISYLVIARFGATA
jgi:hypothetical protein